MIPIIRNGATGIKPLSRKNIQVHRKSLYNLSPVTTYFHSYFIIQFLLLLNLTIWATNSVAMRIREPLELFALQDLKMVGTIYYNHRVWALIKADNAVYKVSIGNYIGNNYGQVTAVHKDRIDIEGYIFDHQRWIQQNTAIVLDQNEPPIDDYQNYSGKKHHENLNFISVSANTISTRHILLLLSELDKKNLMISSQVKGVVNINVEHVPWEHAFDLIVKKSGLQSIQVCGFLLVTTAIEMPNVAPSLTKISNHCVPGDKLSFYFNAVELESVFDLIGDFKGLAVKPDVKIKGEVTLYLIDESWLLVLTLLTKLQGITFYLGPDFMILRKIEKE